MRKIKQIFESVRQKLFLGSSLTLKSARFLYLIPMVGLIMTTLIFGAIIYASSEKNNFCGTWWNVIGYGYIKPIIIDISHKFSL